MKLKSAFTFCLLLIAGFIALALLSYHLIDTEISIFFTCGAFILLMILPACSLKN